MHKLKYALLALPLMFASLAHAQTAGTITFTANQTSATGSLVPVLTWSTTPVATSCAASGSWSGTKFASGTETLASITSNKAYTLTCSWGGGTATVNWTAPTKNTDNSTLTDLAGYKVLFGNSASALTQSKSVSGANTLSTAVAALGAGTWYFAVRALNASGVESSNSAVGSKTVTAANAAKTLNITITPVTTPPPPPPPPGSNEVEPNDFIAQAQLVSTAGTTLNGTMASSGDTDYYRVSLPAGKRLAATMTPNSTSDYELYLFDSSGKAIAWSENGKGVAENVAITNSGSAAVNYYVRVTYYAGGTGATSGKYTIKLSW